MGRAKTRSKTSNDDVNQIEAKSWEAILSMLLYTYTLNLLKTRMKRTPMYVES